MRFSHLFGKTQREDPADAESESHRLLLKAGMIAPMTAGVYSVLPLGWRAMRKIEEIIRQEMDAAGGQEVHMPVLQPIEVWEKTGRRRGLGDILFQLKDRRGREMALAPTHEEAVTLLAKQHISSYRDLPVLVYQIQTKFRDEPRPRGGLLRVREFAMKDLYSFDADAEGQEVSYQTMVQAYRNIFKRCGLPAIAVEADSGAIGGKDSHEFIVLAERGEDTVIKCTACDYAANQERAVSVRPPNPREEPLPLEPVPTPGTKTIEAVAALLGVPTSKTYKAVFYVADGQFVLATIRGDLEVNEVKLKNLLKANEVRMAGDEEVRAAGMTPGYTSPMGVEGVRVIADESVKDGANFIAGANKPDTHYKNANFPRDFQAEIVADIANAEAGHACPRCGKALEASRGIEVGHVFKLGTVYSEALGAYYLDRDGIRKPIVMGSYGIGVGRLLAAAIERNHDELGIVWPAPIAPYQVHLVTLGMDKPEVVEEAERVHEELTGAGIEVLWDDRDESAGVKFNDADLLGMPVRLTVSPRNLKQGQVEAKRRSDGEAELIPTAELIARVRELLSERNPVTTEGATS